MNEARTNPTIPAKCPQCGALLPAGALAGLCPGCLLQQGAAADTASRPESKPFVPPTVDEVARLFPQLEILGFLGKGGMGAVYKARQPALDRLVALKILPAQTAPDHGFADRFTREARALARLSHPNIVAVHEFGQVGSRSAGVPPASQAGVSPAVPPAPGRADADTGETPVPPAGGTPALPYFIMEYVDGVNLRQLQKAGRLSPREALQIVPQICDALQYAHDEGVVHRDIKPENVLVDRKGRVKIADFGLAKILGCDPEALRLTGEGQVMGTPHYMAPEQVEHPQDVDHRADIFSLGVVFYEMLTGELPLGKFQPPSRKVQLDVRLDEVVLHALEKEPERRYQHVGEVKTAVETIAGTPNVAAPATGPLWMHRGLNYRSKATLFGLPLLHVTAGMDPATGKPQVAKGIIAIGGIAKGVVAIGGVAMGGLAFGGLAIGVVAYGGLGIGLLAFGGGALALVAALGGGAMAPIALGGGAIGYFAYGGVALGAHVLDGLAADPAAQRFFLPWAQTLFHHFQLINVIMLVIVLGIGVGLPQWLQWRLAVADDGPAGSSGRAPKIVGWIIAAVLLVNVLIAVIALRPAVSNSQPASGAATTPRPANSAAPFPASPLFVGPVIEQVLTNYAALDLDSGRLVDRRLVENVLEYVREQNANTGNGLAAFAWMQKQGLDVTFVPFVGLYSIGMKLLRLSQTDLHDLAPTELARRLESVNAAAPSGTLILGGTNDVAPVYGFKTSEGGIGLLQVCAHGSDLTHGVDIRYKLAPSGVFGPTGPKAQAATPEQLSEPPTLRFLAWQDEWKTNQPGAARHPDGSAVTNAAELEWLHQIQPSGMDVSSLQLKPEPRFLHLWISHPAFGPNSFHDIGLLDAAGDPIQLGGHASISVGHHDTSALIGNLGWLTPTLSPGAGTNLPSSMTIRLCYTVGPLERVQELAVEPKRTTRMSLEGGSALNGVGQNVDGKAFIAIAVDVEGTRGRRFGVIAIAKDGREIPSKGGGQSGTAGAAVGIADFNFDLPLTEVAKFRIGTRPIRTNEWKDVVVLPKTLSSATTNEQARPVKSAPFIAALPQGEIELVAISRHPATNNLWWQADGTLWTNAGFAISGRHSSDKSGQRLEFIFQRHGLPEDATLECSFEPGTGEVSTGDRVKREGKELPDHSVVVTLLPESAKEVTIRLGVAAGAWKTLVGRTPQAGASSSYHLGNRDCTAIFLDPVETEGETRIAVSYNRVPGWAYRVIAVDTNGQVHVSFPHGLSVDEMATAEGRFAGLPLKQVKEFRFETRPYNYVQFRHVSLAPGERTPVEVVDPE